MEVINHFSHPHQLVLLGDQEVVGDKKEKVCNGCWEAIEGCSSYSCGSCKFFLHKKCAELPHKISHPFHLEHPLVLHEKSPYEYGKQICDVCGGEKGFFYHCSSCWFDLDIKCAIRDFQKLQHFVHHHPLIYVEHMEEIGNITGGCFRCMEPLQAPVYNCGECEFSLHKKCFELLPFEISNHHFHPQHSLFLEPSINVRCNVCRKSFSLAYRCFSCDFSLDIWCAMNPKFTTGEAQKIQHFSHNHALILAEDVDIESQSKILCSGCEDFISSPFYFCPDCVLHLHKICAELPLEINHPTHRRHPLFLLAGTHSHRQGCRCYLCKKSYSGYAYYCSICEFGLEGRDAYLNSVKVEIHEHPFTSLLKTLSFICDACGTNHGDQYFPYTCSQCGLTVHKDCISLPKVIKITRHWHRLSHIYFFQEKDNRKGSCGICLDEVDMALGMYCCSDCTYFVHVNCAIDKFYLEDTVEVEGGKQESEHSLDVDQGARRIHFSHNHSLVFTGPTIDDDKSCDGCMRSISTGSLYKCEQCSFFLHKSCFELPKEARHWICKHSRNLEYNEISYCHYCKFYGSGFRYKCEKCYTNMCIRCHKVPDTFTTKMHEHHHLIFDHKYEKECNGCGAKPDTAMFKCKECDSFALDYRCLTLPDSVTYKNDEHQLVLCASPDNCDLSQCYCDICEKERNQGHWFYKCEDCDVSAHVDCLLGRSPFAKLGKPFRYWRHKHLVTFVKFDFNPPKCNDCNKPCRDVAIQCTKPDCNYIVHWLHV